MNITHVYVFQVTTFTHSTGLARIKYSMRLFASSAHRDSVIFNLYRRHPVGIYVCGYVYSCENEMVL